MAKKVQTPSEIQLDKRNARYHPDNNKQAIRKSLESFGAGRSVLADAEGVLIAGNGVFQQAQELGIPHKVIETDGSELIVIQRKDLQTDDEKRKALALADNRLSDMSEFDPGQLDELLSELEPELQKLAGFEEDAEAAAEKAKKQTLKTRPYRKTHILLSFPPDLMLQIQDKIADLLTLDGVEYEQSSN